jgi:23S rRNA (pseudouridine1915-N3)-methyltransferase
MVVEIWSVGKESEAYIAAGVKSYLEKARPYVSVSLVILPSPKKLVTAEPAILKKAEGEMILQKLGPQHHLIALDERGKGLTSLQWAQYFEGCMNNSVKTLVLLIGGAFGLSEEVRAAAKGVWSLSPLVLPHGLVRLLVSEQVYRAYAIINRLPYHHV